MLVPRLLLAAVGVPALAFLFGWWLLGLCTNLDREERFAASGAVGIVVLALGEFVAFVTGVDQTLFNGGVALALLLAVGSRVWPSVRATGGSPVRLPDAQASRLCHEQAAERRGGDWRLLVFWALGYGHLFLVQSLLPIYVGSYWYGDWYMHYYTTQTFRGNFDAHSSIFGYSLASRTPLFNLAAAAFQSLAGDEFFIYQIAATFLNYCFVAPLYLVLRDLTGARPARLALVLVPLNLWMLHLAWFTWSKLLTAYFLFLALHFYLRFVQLRDKEPARAWRCFLGFWTWALVGTVTHQVSLVYLLALSVHALWLAFRERRAVWLSARHILVLAVVFAAVIGPWYGWLLHEFGLAEIVGRTPLTVMSKEPAPFGWFAVAFCANLGASVVPLKLLEAILVGPLTWETVYDGLTQIYFSLATGALTLSLSVWLLVRGIRRLRQEGWPALRLPRDAEARALGLFVVFGVTLGTLLHPLIIQWGVAHAALFPSVVLLAGLAWTRLARESGRWPRIVAVGMLAEFFGMFWSHVWLAVEAPNVLDPWVGNIPVKEEYHCVFLNDLTGPHDSLFVGATLILQGIFAFFLFAWLRQGQALGDAVENNAEQDNHHLGDDSTCSASK